MTADEKDTVSAKEKGKNKVSVPMPELGSMTPRSSSESVKASQGSVNSAVEREFSSIVGDSGLRGGEAPGTSGSPEEDEISPELPSAILKKRCNTFQALCLVLQSSQFPQYHLLSLNTSPLY